MSSGLYRKQYEALTELADDLGVTYTTPDGSFNQKFCAMCRVIVEGLGDTFTSLQGTFTERKASGLLQVAEAVTGTTVSTALGMRANILTAAKALWDSENDGTGPDFGSAIDWRVFQYLTHTVGGPAVPDEVLQDLQGGTSDGLTLIDNKLEATATAPILQDAPGMIFNGSAWIDLPPYVINEKLGVFTFHVFFKTSASLATASQYVFSRGNAATTSNDYSLLIYQTTGNLQFITGSSAVSGGAWIITQVLANTEYDCWLTVDTINRTKSARINGVDYSTTYDAGGKSESCTESPVIGGVSDKASFPFLGRVYDYEIYEAAVTDKTTADPVQSYPLMNGYIERTPDVATKTLEDIELIVLWGQSNMVGSGGASIPAEYNIEQTDNIYNYYIDGSTLYEGENENLKPLSTSSWTAELPLGLYLTETYGSRKRAFLKVAKDGTGMESYWKPGELGYSLIQRKIIECEIALNGLGYAPTVTNFIGFQGEADMGDDVSVGDSALWETNFNAFYDGLIASTIITSDTQLILAVPHITSPAPARLGMATVKAAQATVCTERGGVAIVTDAYERTDGIHITATGKQSFADDLTPLVADYVPGATNLNLRYGTLDGSLSSANLGVLQDKFFYSYHNGFVPAVAKERTQGCYVDTGVTLTANTQWELTCRFNDNDSQRHGKTSDGTTGRFYVGINAGVFVFGNGNALVTAIPFDSDIHTFILDTSDGTVKMDGVVVATGTGLTDFSRSMFLGGHNEGVYNQGTSGEVYSHKLTVDGVLVQDFTPLEGGNISTYAHYRNEVDDVLFTNDGTSTLKYAEIPALLDGTFAANGLALDKSGGFVHNECKCEIKQTDGDFAVFGGASFWGNGSSWDEKTLAQLTAHNLTNGANGLWVKMSGDNVFRATQYDVTKNWTAQQVDRNETYFGGTGAALRDGGGELITDGSGYVIFAS